MEWNFAQASHFVKGRIYKWSHAGWLRLLRGGLFGGSEESLAQGSGHVIVVRLETCDMSGDRPPGEICRRSWEVVGSSCSEEWITCRPARLWCPEQPGQLVRPAESGFRC